MPDYPLNIIGIRDEPTPQLDQTVVNYKRVQFYLGTRGPFVERMTDAEYFGTEFDDRVRKLRATIVRHEGI